jgi:hypothetical protein
LAGVVWASFFAAFVAELAASSAEEELGAGAAADGAGAGAGAAGGIAWAGGGVTTAGGGSSFLPQAVKAVAATSEASRIDIFIGGLLWMKLTRKKF